MRKYPIISVLWLDHTTFHSSPFPQTDDVDELIRPSLTIGLLYKKTDKYMLIAHHIERFSDGDKSDFTLVFNDSVLAIKEYGTIKLKKLRKGG